VTWLVRSGLLLTSLVFVALATRLTLTSPPDAAEFRRGYTKPASLLLGQGPPADFAQDIVGARALLLGGEAYPVLGPAFQTLGLSWDLQHASTHAPTAFLFALPFANLPWSHASALWALAMLGAVVATAVALGARWKSVMLLLPVLLWPPVLGSLSQLTPIWLLGAGLAWRWRAAPFALGVALGVASLPKYFAAVALLPFVWRREWRVLVGFAAVWVAALIVLLTLNAEVLRDYLTTSRSTGLEQIERVDNGALFPVIWGTGRLPVLVVAIVFVAVLAMLALRQHPMSFDMWGIWTWLGVALLPIAWNYSLLPLLPWLLHVLRQGPLAGRLLAGTTMWAAMLSPLSNDNPKAVALSIAAAGLALAAHAQRRECGPSRPLWVAGRRARRATILGS
jgi:Glycosyltransferase family 87